MYVELNETTEAQEEALLINAIGEDEINMSVIDYVNQSDGAAWLANGGDDYHADLVLNFDCPSITISGNTAELLTGTTPVHRPRP